MSLSMLLQCRVYPWLGLRVYKCSRTGAATNLANVKSQGGSRMHEIGFPRVWTGLGYVYRVLRDSGVARFQGCQQSGRQKLLIQAAVKIGPRYGPLSEAHFHASEHCADPGYCLPLPYASEPCKIRIRSALGKY